MKKIITVLALLVTLIYAQNFEANYKVLLSKYVRASGAIDYSGMKSDRLYSVTLKQLLNYQTNGLTSNDDRLAFWINAYNLLLVNFIVRQNSKKISSIHTMYDLAKFGRTPLSQYSYRVDFKNLTVSDIEKKIYSLKKSPIVYTALFSPSVSGVKLKTTPYSGRDIDKELEAQAVKFYNSKDGIVIVGREYKTSLLLKKFSFLNVKKSLEFVKKYNKNIKDKKFDGYLVYNWSINRVKQVK